MMLLPMMQAAAIWEHMARVFHAWAGSSRLGGLTHPDQYIPFRDEDTRHGMYPTDDAPWYPIVRLVRLVSLNPSLRLKLALASWKPCSTAP